METMQYYISISSKNTIHTTICRKKRCDLFQVYTINNIKGRILCKYCYKKNTKKQLQILKTLGVIISKKRKKIDIIESKVKKVDIIESHQKKIKVSIPIDKEIKKSIIEETKPVRKYFTSCIYCSEYYIDIPVIFHKYFSCIHCCDKRQLLYDINKPEKNIIKYPFRKSSSPKSTLFDT